MGAPQALSGAGAVNLTSYHTQFTSSGTGDALTMAIGTIKGQTKKVSYIAEGAGGDTGILTPSVTTGFASCTFNSVGDYAVFVFNGAYWKCIDYVGCTLA